MNAQRYRPFFRKKQTKILSKCDLCNTFVALDESFGAAWPKSLTTRYSLLRFPLKVAPRKTAPPTWSHSVRKKIGHPPARGRIVRTLGHQPEPHLQKNEGPDPHQFGRSLRRCPEVPVLSRRVCVRPKRHRADALPQPRPAAQNAPPLHGWHKRRHRAQSGT